MERFTTFTFIGIIAYGWFQSALTQAAGTVSGNKDLVLRPHFAPSILPLVSVSSSMLHFLFALPLIFVIVILEEHHIPPATLMIPMVMSVQFLLCLGLGYLAAIINIKFRDTRHILDVLLRLFYFLSPVFYDPSMVPEKYLWIYKLNPLVAILQSYRNIILHGTMPPWSSLGIVAMFSLAIAWIGWRVFQQQSHRFLEEL
jgi:lipopolysaccharide transport system permease protein